MTRDEWRLAEPVLTRALHLPPDHQQHVIDSAFLEATIQRELLDVLQRSSSALPRILRSTGKSGVLDSSSGLDDARSFERVLPLLEAGQALMDGRFSIVRQLGRGGMGEVYLAHDKALGALVALKVLFYTASREAQHARLCAGHPHIATLHDVFETRIGDEMRTVLVMEYVAGKPASRLIDDGPVAVRDAVRWTRHVAAALAHAHDRDVLHCDLKPANILITPDEGAKVLDFGIGRATFERDNPGEPLLGTAPYMAPEQLLERRFSQTGDVYGLGVTLFELVTGRLPFEGDMPELVLQIAGAPPPRVSEFRDGVPERLDEIVARALAKKPTERYRSARAFDRALEALEWELVTDSSPVPAPIVRIPPPVKPEEGTGPVAAPQPMPPWAQQRVWRVVGVSLAIILGLTLVGFITSTGYYAAIGLTADFRQESFLSWPIWGLRSLLPGAVLAVALVSAGLVMFAAIYRLTLMVTFGPVRRGTERITAGVNAVVKRLRDSATSTTASILFVTQWVLLAVTAWWFKSLLGGIDSLIADSLGDLTPLSPANNAEHQQIRQVFSLEFFAFAAGWLSLLRTKFVKAERGGWISIAGGIALTFFTLMLLVIPYRILRHNEHERVSYRSQTCYLLGERGNEALLFCPLREPPRNHIVRLDDPALERGGLVENVFSRVENAKSALGGER